MVKETGHWRREVYLLPMTGFCLIEVYFLACHFSAYASAIAFFTSITVPIHMSG